MLKNKSASKVFVLLICFLCSKQLIAQNTSPLSVKIKYDINYSADTIVLSVYNKEKKGSLLIVANYKSLELIDSFYFPLLDSNNLFALVIPQNLKGEDFFLKALYYPSIFKVSGKLISKTNNENINAIVITENQKIYNRQIALNESKEFKLPAIVFEKKASIFFNYINGKKRDRPDIEISQSPLASDFTNLVFEDTIRLEKKIINNTLPKIVSDSIKLFTPNKKIKLLATVVVNSVAKRKAEKYNDENSTGIFKDGSEKIIDCLDNDEILSYTDCLSYLRIKVPGLNLNADKYGESSMTWRGKEVKAFYIDENAVDIDQILSVNVNDIAIIKAYPPPFFGSNGSGDGGGIAIYLRKGSYRRVGTSDKKWVFSIKGYSKSIHVLFE